MKLDLKRKHFVIVNDILLNYPKLKFYVFGSRAKGGAKELSDLDLVVMPSPTKLELTNLKEAFEDSDLPYKVDLVVWDDIDKNFKANIENDLVLFSQKS